MWLISLIVNYPPRTCGVFSYMVENLYVINNCHACCIDPRLELNFVEAATLRNLGTILIGLMYFNGRRNTPSDKDGKAYYDMQSQCGALNFNGLCDLYNTIYKPESCSSLVPGSEDCLIIRAEV